MKKRHLKKLLKTLNKITVDGGLDYTSMWKIAALVVKYNDTDSLKTMLTACQNNPEMLKACLEYRGDRRMKKFYNRFITPALAILLWLILTILPYGISKLIVDGINRSNAKHG